MTNENTNIHEINDAELISVSGGRYADYFDTPEEVAYRFHLNSSVELVTCELYNCCFTQKCTVIDRKVAKNNHGDGYCAWYKVSCEDSEYNNKWYQEMDFEGGFIKSNDIVSL